ncbi:ROK family protein [Lactiplantibacillus pentosus]|uniref:ROK family protein n=1 Tax=Lactiplantibacillus pentosus TaxID=1589 RepID=UPI003C1C0E78
MQPIGLIDIGGTTIKFAVLKSGHLISKNKIATPDNLVDFYKETTAQVNQMRQEHQILGVGISSPGAVNKSTGVIEGASALPYIHNFDIKSSLTERFELPISIENDANCAALAELEDGAGQGVNSLCFLIIGTGVGGAVIVNHQVWHGAHLFGGGFGYTLVDDQSTLSELGTSVSVAKRYNSRHGSEGLLDGRQVFELSNQGNVLAQNEVLVMYQSLAKAIYNLQYSFDPELIVLGGAVSNNPQLIPGINKEVERIRKIVKIASIRPKIVACHFTDEANLRGAAVDFTREYREELEND